MQASTEELDQLIRAIHYESPMKFVLVLTGAGMQSLAWLTSRTGCSRSLLEATVPYDREAFADYLGSNRPPKGFVNDLSARLLAGRAFTRALELHKTGETVIGVSCTGALVSEKEKKGNHRAHIAIWSHTSVKCYNLFLTKGARNRQQEEDVVSRFILNIIAMHCGVDKYHLHVPITDEEKSKITTSEFQFTPIAERLYKHEIQFLRIDPDGSVSSNPPPPNSLILSGSFNPFHYGHYEILMTAAAFVSQKGKPFPSIFFEISAFNADKPPIDMKIMLERINQFAGIGSVLITNAPTFVQKTRLFPECVFIVGYDTAVRILSKRYYDNSDEGLAKALQEIRDRKCKFIVGGRIVDGRFVSPSELQAPEFSDLFQSMEDFRADISSTEIREGEKKRWRRCP